MLDTYVFLLICISSLFAFLLALSFVLVLHSHVSASTKATSSLLRAAFAESTYILPSILLLAFFLSSAIHISGVQNGVLAVWLGISGSSLSFWSLRYFPVSNGVWWWRREVDILYIYDCLIR